MAKIEWVHHRLERWALWMSRGGTNLGFKTPATFRDYVPDDASREAVVPVGEEEAWATHEAIKRLPEPLGETVARYYLHDSDRCRKHLAISASVLSQRIDQAHRQLVVMFAKPATAEEPSWYKRVQQQPDGGSFPR